MGDTMDERVKRIDTVKKCENYAANALERGHPELAAQARQRALEIRAEAYGASNDAEREALQAIYAYEEVLSHKNGKRTPASRTWQMIKRHGIIEGVERAVNRPVETQGYKALVEMGLEKYAFEYVILRHPALFSDEAIALSKSRTAEWEQ